MAEPVRAAPSKIGTMLALFPRMSRFVYHLARDRRVPLTTKLAVLGLGIYIASPFDLIPDGIPFAGAMDDLLLIPIVMNYVFATIPEEILIEHWGEDIETLRQFGRPRREQPAA